MGIRDKIHKVRRNKDAIGLVNNFGYLTIMQVVSYVFPFLTIPYLAEVIGIDGFGKIAFASAVIVWFNTVVGWGFPYTATRDVVRNRDDEEKVSEIFSNTFWARCFLMIITFILLLMAIFFIPIFRENSNILLVTFLIVPGRVMFPEWFFQAMERMKYITLFNVLSKLLFTVAVFLFIKEKSDFILQPLFISLGFICSGIIAMYLIIKKWKVKLQPPNFHLIKKSIRESTDVFINNIMPNFYSGFSIILLGFYGGNISNGILDAGNKFPQVLNQFLDVISRVFYPFLSRRIDKHSFYAKINIYLSLIVSIMLFVLAPLLIESFFTPEFYDAIVVLRITSVSLVFISIGKVYGVNYMIIEGYEKELRNITITCSVIGLFFAFPFVYYFDFIGAAINITMIQIVLGVSIMITAKKIKKKNKVC